MLSRLLSPLKSLAYRVITDIAGRVKQWTTPLAETFVGGVVSDAMKSKPELIAENALLRQQVIVLKRQVKQVRLKGHDRLVLVVLASKVRAWREALLLVKPETVLGWHRGLFRLVWKGKSTTTNRRSRVPEETINLIRQMAHENRLWGAERIQGELQQLGIKLAKRPVQKYMRAARPSRPHGQTWSTFLKNHASQIWACDFLPVIDLRFRQLYAFFLMELGSRRVVHLGVTRHPTDAWVAQQLREATPFDEHPTYLIRDNDSKFAEQFARVAADRGIKVLRTPYRAPKANAFCERLLRSVHQECLDHFLIFGERHLQRLLKDYVAYYNHARPHQGLGQRLPIPLADTEQPRSSGGSLEVIPILGGLHHQYRLAA
jgi:transposase InsO family protein